MPAAIACGLPPDTAGAAGVVGVTGVVGVAATGVAGAFFAACAFFAAAACVAAALALAAAFTALADFPAAAWLARAEAATFARWADERDTEISRAVAARLTNSAFAAASAAVLAVAGALSTADAVRAVVFPTPIALLVDAYAVAPMDTVAIAAEVRTAGRRSSSTPLGRAARCRPTLRGMVTEGPFGGGEVRQQVATSRDHCEFYRS